MRFVIELQPRVDGMRRVKDIAEHFPRAEVIGFDLTKPNVPLYVCLHLSSCNFSHMASDRFLPTAGQPLLNLNGYIIANILMLLTDLSLVTSQKASPLTMRDYPWSSRHTLMLYTSVLWSDM